MEVFLVRIHGDGESRDNEGRSSYFETAIGSSQEPGTDWTTMFDSFTPLARSFFLTPSRRGSMIAVSVDKIPQISCVPSSLDTHCGQVGLTSGKFILVFHRAWTMPMRRALPSCCWASPGPLMVVILGGLGVGEFSGDCLLLFYDGNSMCKLGRALCQ